jgi:rhodanese-related sulfurtransferase
MKHLILSAFLSLVSVLATHAEDRSGLWNWTTPGQNGGLDRIYNLRLKVEGSGLSAILITPNRTNDTFTETVIRDAKIEGDTLSFTLPRQARRATNSPVAGAEAAASVAGSTDANATGRNRNATRTVTPTRYVGAFRGSAIEGTIESPARDGKITTNVWHAARNADGKLVAGTRIVLKPGYNEAGHKIVNDTRYKELTVDQIEKYLAEHPDSTIVDTRSPSEFAEGHLPKSENHDLTDEATYMSVLSKLDKSKRYVVVSNSGGYRTIRALDYFESHDFPHAVVLRGGFGAWVDAGRPSEK